MKTRRGLLTRAMTGRTGTFGQLVMDDGFTCVTGELRWLNNKSGLSCIPEGTYLCAMKDSPKHGRCYYVLDVAGRSDIEIHAANWMGEKSAGLRCELLGCIAPGEAVEEVEGQLGVTRSKATLKKLVDNLGGVDWFLEIRWAHEVA